MEIEVNIENITAPGICPHMYPFEVCVSDHFDPTCTVTHLPVLSYLKCERLQQQTLVHFGATHNGKSFVFFFALAALLVMKHYCIHRM